VDSCSLTAAPIRRLAHRVSVFFSLQLDRCAIEQRIYPLVVTQLAERMARVALSSDQGQDIRKQAGCNRGTRLFTRILGLCGRG